MTAQQYLLDNIRDYTITKVKTDITNIQVGDDDTTPSESDTAIGNLIGTGSIDILDDSQSDELRYTSKFGVTEFVGDTIKECTLYDSVNARILTHNLTTQKVKTSTQIFWVTTKVKTKVTNGTI